MAVVIHNLKESNEFLNALIDNINSAVFVLDDSIRIQQFNRALEVLFGKDENEIHGELCGNAMGCVFAIRENNPCGTTSHCNQCELRGSILRTLVQRVPTRKSKLIREFLIQGRFLTKHLEYSTKTIQFAGQEMILVIVDDITEGEVQRIELIEKQKRIDEDLRAAAGIQQSLLPQRIPELDGIEAAWKFIPCEIIGGDIFNLFALDDDHLGCYMLDVSGHGVTSALVTVSVSRTLQPTPPLRRLMSPAQVCKTLNREYPFERFGTFLTMNYLVINHREGTIDYVNAGHPPIILLHRGGELELLSEGGSIIGLGDIVPYKEYRRRLVEGDRIILYTDGVIEHRNAEQELYGQERLHGCLMEMSESPIEEILAEVLRSITDFGGEERLRDDVSLLGIEFKGCR